MVMYEEEDNNEEDNNAPFLPLVSLHVSNQLSITTKVKTSSPLHPSSSTTKRDSILEKALQSTRKSWSTARSRMSTVRITAIVPKVFNGPKLAKDELNFMGHD